MSWHIETGAQSPKVLLYAQLARKSRETAEAAAGGKRRGGISDWGANCKWSMYDEAIEEERDSDGTPGPLPMDGQPDRQIVGSTDKCIDPLAEM